MSDALATALRLTVAGSDATFELCPARLVVAGYTGRDEAAVRHHIDELAAIGIAPPPAVPMLYDLDPALLTAEATAPAAETSSGEVEPVFVRHDGHWYLGVGSDHTDRELERADIKASKAACPKPLGPQVLALPDGVADGDCDDAWDAGALASFVDGERYQAGPLAALRTPGDLLPRVLRAFEDDDPAGDLVVFAGTVPLLDGAFRFGRDWHLELTLAGRTLSHTYRAR
ncbi:DUF2848 family protein [Geodermatophilus sp. URMC 64]